MCGIISIFLDQSQIGKEKIQNALNLIQHRGPDEQGIWVNQDKTVALGHTRLSIIDLEHGHQPLSCSEDKLHAVVNGEFYDFEHIRADLIAKGYTFKSKSDSEILINIYKAYGTKCLEHLRGEFSFVLYDEHKNRIFAARDRFGIKPLFYTRYKNHLYFASEMKSLFALGIPCEWNGDTIYDMEHLVYSQEQTIFKNIQCVKPGHAIYGTLNLFEEFAYWDFNYITQANLKENFNEQNYIEGFEYHFHEAVRLRLRSDVPVANYLSGGLDSCCVLAMMAELSTQPIEAFTLSFDGKEYDEADIAIEMAEHVGAKHTVIPVTNQSMSDNFADCVWHNETLFFNNNTVAKFILSQHVRDAGYKVVLTGEGADEVSGGYAPFREDLLLHNTEGQDPETVQKLLKQLMESNKISQGLLVSDQKNTDLHDIKELLGFVPSMFTIFTVRGKFFESIAHPDLKRPSYDAYLRLINSLDLNQLKAREPVTQSMYIWSKSTLPGLILTMLGDRMEMAHSIEGRVPFLDHKLVEYLTQLPVSVKIKGLTEKYIIREALKSKLTKTIYNRQKHPFLSPPASEEKPNPMTKLMQDVFYSSALDNLPFYNKNKVLALLEKLPNMDFKQRQQVDGILLQILTACIIQDRFKPSFNQ